MLGRFPHLSKVMIKILEIGGAGCASAVAALSSVARMSRRIHPQSMPPAVVRLAPADEQMIKRVRDESAALVEKLRTATDAPARPLHRQRLHHLLRQRRPQALSREDGIGCCTAA